jgi:starch phosphorylase
MIASGFFCPDDSARYQEIVDALLKHGDHFLLLADYASYVAAQDNVDELYRDPTEWTKRSILNVAGMGKFSSDRTIREYAEHIWHIAPIDTREKTAIP